jgi:Family of unknown function (DUF6496)
MVLAPPLGTLAGRHPRGNHCDPRLCAKINDACDFVDEPHCWMKRSRPAGVLHVHFSHALVWSTGSTSKRTEDCRKRNAQKKARKGAKGGRVRSRKQAIAIGLSEAHKKALGSLQKTTPPTFS